MAPPRSARAAAGRNLSATRNLNSRPAAASGDINQARAQQIRRERILAERAAEASAAARQGRAPAPAVNVQDPAYQQAVAAAAAQEQARMAAIPEAVPVRLTPGAGHIDAPPPGMGGKGFVPGQGPYKPEVSAQWQTVQTAQGPRDIPWPMQGKQPLSQTRQGGPAYPDLVDMHASMQGVEDAIAYGRSAGAYPQAGPESVNLVPVMDKRNRFVERTPYPVDEILAQPTPHLTSGQTWVNSPEDVHGGYQPIRHVQTTEPNPHYAQARDYADKYFRGKELAQGGQPLPAQHHPVVRQGYQAARAGQDTLPQHMRRTIAEGPTRETWSAVQVPPDELMHQYRNAPMPGAQRQSIPLGPIDAGHIAQQDAIARAALAREQATPVHAGASFNVVSRPAADHHLTDYKRPAELPDQLQGVVPVHSGAPVPGLATQGKPFVPPQGKVGLPAGVQVDLPGHGPVPLTQGATISSRRGELERLNVPGEMDAHQAVDAMHHSAGRARMAAEVAHRSPTVHPLQARAMQSHAEELTQQAAGAQAQLNAAYTHIPVAERQQVGVRVSVPHDHDPQPLTQHLADRGMAVQQHQDPRTGQTHIVGQGEVNLRDQMEAVQPLARTLGREKLHLPSGYSVGPENLNQPKAKQLGVTQPNEFVYQGVPTGQVWKGQPIVLDDGVDVPTVRHHHPAGDAPVQPSNLQGNAGNVVMTPGEVEQLQLADARQRTAENEARLGRRLTPTSALQQYGPGVVARAEANRAMAMDRLTAVLGQVRS